MSPPDRRATPQDVRASPGSSDAHTAVASADAGDAAADSGADDSASCRPVTFHIAAGTRATYCGQGPCSTTDLVSVRNAGGQALAIRELSGNPCSIVDCSSCEPVDSCLCDGGDGALPTGGLDVTWLGAVWRPSGTCGNSVAREQSRRTDRRNSGEIVTLDTRASGLRGGS